jgi:hypothetical protein
MFYLDFILKIYTQMPSFYILHSAFTRVKRIPPIGQMFCTSSLIESLAIIWWCLKPNYKSRTKCPKNAALSLSLLWWFQQGNPCFNQSVGYFVMVALLLETVEENSKMTFFFFKNVPSLCTHLNTKDSLSTVLIKFVSHSSLLLWHIFFNVINSSKS